MNRADQALIVATPFVTVTAVALGLRIGAPATLRAAQVFAAPPAAAGTNLAWQVFAFEEERGVRRPLAGTEIVAIARGAGSEARSTAKANADGVAEIGLARPATSALDLEIDEGGTVLARGAVALDAEAIGGVPPRREGPWMPFARRAGALRMDVAVVGLRVAPGFDATVCVLVTDAATRAPVAGAAVEVVDDPSLSASRGERSDSAGWAILHVTPVGLAVGLALHARLPDGRDGAWEGGLVVSPGGAAIRTRARWAPSEPPRIEVVAASPRATEYVEVDDAAGRAWAAALDFAATPAGEPPEETLTLPKLAPGLYWAVASGAADGATVWAPSTTVLPFFVAANDDAALKSGTEAVGCSPRRDAREAARALVPCLALATAYPVPRVLAIDGAPARRAAADRARGRGLAVAIAALVVGALLEIAVLGRVAHSAGARVTGVDAAPRWKWSLAIALLVALMGFVLFGAFLSRVP
jgi:hypothetical protein